MARSRGPIYIADNSVVAINDALQQLLFMIDELKGETDETTVTVGPHTHAGITGPQGEPGQDGGPITIPSGTIDHDDLANVTANQHHAKLHSATHGPSGVDALRLDDLEVPEDNTDLDSTVTTHGLLRKLDNNSNHFLDGAGGWSTPVVSGSEAQDVSNIEGCLTTPIFEIIHHRSDEFITELAGGLGILLDPVGWKLITSVVTNTSSATYDVTGLAGWNEIWCVIRGCTLGGSDARGIQLSSDNGASFYTSSGDYIEIGNAGAESNETILYFHSTNATLARSGSIHIPSFNKTLSVAIRPCLSPNKTATTTTSLCPLFVATANPLNAVRLTTKSGNVYTAGTFYVFGR